MEDRGRVVGQQLQPGGELLDRSLQSASVVERSSIFYAVVHSVRSVTVLGKYQREPAKVWSQEGTKIVREADFRGFELPLAYRSRQRKGSERAPAKEGAARVIRGCKGKGV